MDLRIQPKPEVEVKLADRGIVSWEDYFVEKQFEKINQYFFPGHLIRKWRPKAELIYPPVPDENVVQYECDFNRDIQSCFVEDYAEEVYLRSPPPCFVLFGKYYSEVVKLGQQIADEFESVLISVDNIVSHVIKTDTQSARFLDSILRVGVSITLNFILALLSFVAHTPEARHRGYVLCGLPSFSYLYDLSAEQQFDYLFSWDNKPTVFINVDFDDEDMVFCRTNTRCEITKVGKTTNLSFHFNYNPPEEEEEDDDDDEGGEKEEDDDDVKKVKKKENIKTDPDLNILPSRPWVKLPRDEESEVWTELEFYETKIKPVLDLIKSRVDPQFFITIDSRLKNGFQIVQARLSILQIWKTPSPFPFYTLKGERNSENKLTLNLDGGTDNEEERDEHEGESEKEVEEEEDKLENKDEAEINAVIDEPPQTAFLTLFNKKILSPKFRWELSHYNYMCPVSMRDGKLVEGKTKYAVVFLKYIFFLHDKECLDKFLKNPRPYVLPIRPKPPCRFIVLGYPFCGKTSLAESLSSEFSIPVIDVEALLKKDLILKKNTYLEFCRQKAEAREIVRLTAAAWQNWRSEEEQRIGLIEKWISYIQCLLRQRIKEFYSSTLIDNTSEKETQVQSHSPLGSNEFEGEATDRVANEELRLELRGIRLIMEMGDYMPRGSPSVEGHPTPSSKLVQALKHEDFDFDEKCLEVEANLFFSSLWNSFSNQKQSELPLTFFKKELEEEEIEEEEIEGEDTVLARQRSVDSEESEKKEIPVNWCSMLPPQSLSSFLLKKTPYTTRERRKSFQILLTAASKKYWDSSTLKTEFVKWRLPCFMDIPLCEIFLDNPFLLYKYCPDWLKERPLIPDPINSDHPSVVEAGKSALLRASIVNVSHDKEEIWKLINLAVEKAERDGMRVSGEILSPGGWVIDNMVLDLEVWCALFKQNLVVDFIYILKDADPDHRRIINRWFDLHQELEEELQLESVDSSAEESESSKSNKELSGEHTPREPTPTSLSLSEEEEESYLPQKSNFLTLLKERTEFDKHGEKQLDNIYNIIVEKLTEVDTRIPVCLMDVFSHNLLRDTLKNWNDVKGDLSIDDITLAPAYLSESIHNIHPSPSGHLLRANMTLGLQLEIFTAKVMEVLHVLPENERNIISLSLAEKVKFFESLLKLPKQLQVIKKFLEDTNRTEKLIEIDIANKTSKEIFFDVKTNLLKHFIKKPRELEQFEVDEVLKELGKKKKIQTVNPGEDDDGDVTSYEEEGEREEEIQNYEKKEEEEDSNIIYGEAGPFCIVNLERSILLEGKPKFVLRYYGKLYFFWNEDAKKKFIENPEKYAPYYSAIRCLPPLRIFVVGPVGSGKTTLSQAISEQTSVHHINYFSFLSFNLVPYEDNQLNKITALSDEHKLLLHDGYNEEAKLMKNIFTKAPYDKKLYWLENPFDLKEEQNEVVAWGSWIASNANISRPKLKYETIEPVDKKPKIHDTSKYEDFMSMKEFRSIMKKYVNMQADLPQNCIMKTLHHLWQDDIFVNSGFVLEGFPFRQFDIRVMIENNWIPDIIIEIKLPESLVVERNIDQAMNLWEEKLKQEMSEEEALEDTLKNIKLTLETHKRLNLMTAKRIEALKNLKLIPDSNVEDFEGNGEEDEESGKMLPMSYQGTSRSRMGSSTLSSGPSEASDWIDYERAILPHDVDLKVHAEVSEIIKQEFKPLVFKPVFETEEAGRARITADYEKNYRIDVEEIRKIKSSLKDSLDVPWYELDGTEDPKKNQINLYRELNRIKQRTNQRSEFAFPLSLEIAEKLLKQGFYFLSKFGRWCPVQIYRMKNPIHMFIPLREKQKIFPIAYRNYIYFVGGKQEKINFLKNPLKYTFNEPHHPNIPLRLAIIGPPKSGKTTLCNRLGFMFSLKIVTMGTAIRFVFENMPNTTLKKSIDNYLKRGCFLPLSLKMEALAACLNDPVCVTQGFVLDGIPFDAALAQSLAERGLLPFVIISLVCDAYFGKVNREDLDLKMFRLPYKQRVNLDSRYKDWDDTYKRFFQWNQDTYNNLYELNAKLNVVDIFYEAYEIIRKSYFGILYYVEYCVTDRPLPLKYMCVGQHEYELRKSEYQSICPVCWAEKRHLTCSTDPPLRSNLVQYLNHFYFICDSHMEKFIRTPKKYFPPHAPECPKVLPKLLSKGMFEAGSISMKVHGNGRCPVTRIDFPDSLDWEGSWNHAAAYGEKIFLCKNESMLRRFVAEPWRYCYADTEFEVSRSTKSQAVKQLEPPVLTSLPPMGFLEQTVAKLIQDALHIVAGIRPVYPNVPHAAMACTFVGLYLKVFNNKEGYLHLETQFLRFMMYHCVSYRYRIKNIRKPIEEGENESSEESSDEESEDSEHRTGKSSKASGKSENQENNDRCWVDLESPGDNKIWSAKLQTATDTKFTIENGELSEVIEHPKELVIVVYRTSNLRLCPLPPVSNLITYIYSCKKNVELPKPFKVNSLFQPRPLFPTPFRHTLPFAPEREIPSHLYNLSKPRYTSQANIYEGKRNLSENTLEEPKPKKADETHPDLTFMAERFVPRFHLLDRIVPNATPVHPKVIESQPITYNPHKEYTYTLLMSHFFKTSHLLRCIEWRDCNEVFEFTSVYDKNLCTVPTDFAIKTKISPSVFSMVSKTSNQLNMENITFYDDGDKKQTKTIMGESESTTSLINFMHLLILENLNNIFANVAERALSYESFETHAVQPDFEFIHTPAVVFREILPYPPLLWDLSSRPYYAYRAASVIFELPHTENIVHRRLFSVLDGVKDSNDEYKFMRIPSWVDPNKKKVDEKQFEKIKPKKKFPKAQSIIVRRSFFLYDVFDLHWTSFLIYPFSWAFDLDIKDKFKDPVEEMHSSSVEEEVVRMSVVS